MSSQADIPHRLVNAREQLKQLKASQILGGDNMNYFEYTPPDLSHQFPGSGLDQWDRLLLLTFESEQPFPLVSIECDIYENGVLVTNPRSMSPSPHNVSQSSVCFYDYLDNDMLIVTMNETGYFTINGRRLKIGDPKVYMYGLYISPSGATVTVSIRNIKIRTSCAGIACATMTQAGIIT